jgi:hypothetical protein
MDLAAVYGTPGGPSAEDIEKAGEAQLFAKLASDNNINLANLDDDQVMELYNQTFGKEAAIPPQFQKGNGDDKDEKKDEKKCEKCGKADCKCPAAKDEEKEAAAAQQEFETEKEGQAKLAEADYLGRVMAHSFTQELGLIGDQMKTASAEGAPAAPAAAPAAAQIPELNIKQASALDKLAAKKALEKAAEVGHDLADVQSRIEAIFTLGVKESEKVAAAENIQQGMEVRALELLEQAGYEVNWTK